MMATWQFDLYVVPRDAVGRYTGTIPVDELRCRNWWKGYKPAREAIRQLTMELPRVKDWHASISAWGHEDGDRVDVVDDGRGAWEWLVRIDARAPSGAFLDAVSTAVREADCVLVTTEGTILPPIASEIELALEESAARRFVEDPSDFFDRLDPDV